METKLEIKQDGGVVYIDGSGHLYNGLAFNESLVLTSTTSISTNKVKTTLAITRLPNGQIQVNFTDPCNNLVKTRIGNAVNASSAPAPVARDENKGRRSSLAKSFDKPNAMGVQGGNTVVVKSETPAVFTQINKGDKGKNFMAAHLYVSPKPPSPKATETSTAARRKEEGEEGAENTQKTKKRPMTMKKNE